MHAIEIPLFDRMMLASGRTAVEMDRELRLLLAVKRFELGRVSLGQAAEVSRGPRDFTDLPDQFVEVRHDDKEHDRADEPRGRVERGRQSAMTLDNIPAASIPQAPGC